jgi:hypothetical protein
MARKNYLPLLLKLFMEILKRFDRKSRDVFELFIDAHGLGLLRRSVIGHFLTSRNSCLFEMPSLSRENFLHSIPRAQMPGKVSAIFPFTQKDKRDLACTKSYNPVPQKPAILSYVQTSELFSASPIVFDIEQKVW